MVKRLLGTVAGAALLGASIWIGVRGSGAIPPLGPVLDPANGVWALPHSALPLGRRAATIPGIERPVDVLIDDRGVPHVFARNELDAYRALGYLVARDRLFQLEIQARAAEGTLTEMIGPQVLASDREARKLGFGRLVERTMKEADRNTRAFQSMEAYAQGIDAWIDQMRPAELPLEYRLLGARPRRWEPAHTYFLLSRMALTLAFNDASLLKARAAGRIGWAAADALFPVNSPIQEPIQPNPVDSTRYLFSSLAPPGRADSLALETTPVAAAIGRALGRDLENHPAEDALGSNNWAVAPSRTRGGHALLAGDPHLELTLPSIWYQAHLVVPDSMDVAGVTLPGAPWVILGYNRNIAWSFTNTGSDVNDFYREVVDDSIAPRRYQIDGAWRELDLRVETYRDRQGRVLATDTVRFTHRGPLWKTGSSWLSMAWTVYDAKSNGLEFADLPHARTAGEFLETTRSYWAPSQNMVVADRRGTIAIRSTGRYPIRPNDGRGDLIQDGSRSASDWTGSLPLEFYPFALNPPRGYLSSANQQPVDPAVNSHFLGANWFSPWRAMRINQLLRADSQVTPDAMRRFQTDPASVRADLFVPILLGRGADTARVRRAPAEVQEARRLLAEWDRRYDKDNRRAVLFEAVMTALVRNTWDELVPTDTGAAGGEDPSPRPADAVLLGLARDSANPWWDRRATASVVEHRDDVVELALAQGLRDTRTKYGEPTSEGWRWSKVHTTNIYHLLRLPTLSALGLAAGGGPSTLSPSSGAGTDGPSWRMVVELGPAVVAWGTYPGGQSGNPASRHYLDFLPAWLEGRLDSLITPAAPDSMPAARIESRLSISGRGR